METLFCYFLVILATQQSGARLGITLRRTQVSKIGQAVICWSIIGVCPWVVRWQYVSVGAKQKLLKNLVTY